MKHFFPFCTAFACALAIASCNTMGGSSGGTQVKDPTVDQIAQLEKEWGVKPRETKARPTMFPANTDASLIPAQPAPAPAPFPQAAEAPAPAPATPPPVFEPPPQAATPAQIQKLKN